MTDCKNQKFIKTKLTTKKIMHDMMIIYNVTYTIVIITYDM